MIVWAGDMKVQEERVIAIASRIDNHCSAIAIVIAIASCIFSSGQGIKIKTYNLSDERFLSVDKVVDLDSGSLLAAAVWRMSLPRLDREPFLSKWYVVASAWL